MQANAQSDSSCTDTEQGGPGDVLLPPQEYSDTPFFQFADISLSHH